jgi:hypothetical protein
MTRQPLGRSTRTRIPPQPDSQSTWDVCLVFFDESALSLTPNVRRTWAPRGQPPVLVHRFNWKKASMAAALCYGVRGGGAQLAFHIHPGNYDTNSLIQVLGELRRFLGGERATLLSDGLPDHRSRAMRALVEHPAALAGGGAPARRSSTRPRACGPASRPSSWQPHFADPGRGDRPSPQGHPARPSHPPPAIFVPPPDRPVGLMTQQADTPRPVLGRMFL